MGGVYHFAMVIMTNQWRCAHTNCSGWYGAGGSWRQAAILVAILPLGVHMVRNFLRMVVWASMFAGTQVHADIAAIRVKDLPQEPKVLEAFEDAQVLEPYSSSFADRWTYPVKKADVAKRLKRAIDSLRGALEEHSQNAELQLLTGLVAHYGYNVDVEGSHEASVSALDAANKLLPNDYRPQWFFAGLQCQTKESKEGAEKLLAIEAAHSADELPTAFWNDYIECAGITNMPSHLIQAARILERRSAPESRITKVLVDSTQKRFEPFDANKKYEPKAVWFGSVAGDEVTFTSTICGIRLVARKNWDVNQLALSNGSCVAYFSTGPYKAVVDSLRPSLLVLVQQPKQNETLEDFAKKFLTKGTFLRFDVGHCPARNCIGMAGIQPGMYKANGDGHGRSIFFERDQPAFPGLAFESPTSLPDRGDEGAPKYYRPGQVTIRIPGKLYYLVLLDTAASIEDPALKDYEFFLKNLTVE
jgi:hypothetical protein